MQALPERQIADLMLWQRFQSGDCPPEEIQQSRALTRWSRSLATGLSAINSGEPRMNLDALPEARERFAPLLAPGAPFDAFASTLAREGFCGLFCTDDGLVVARRIGEPFANTSAETSIIEGAVWSEEARGTNGVGTALAERSSVAVIGTEHYELRNHCLACYATPVRDVRDRIVAVLDASGPASMASEFVHASVLATAAAIEALLVARTYDAAVPGGLFELERLLARFPHASLIVERTGYVRRANQRLRGMLQDSETRSLATLVRTKFDPTETRFEWQREGAIGPLRGLQVELEPIGNPDDPFATLVHLTSRRRRLALGSPAERVPDAFATIIGSDPLVVAARAQAARFARTDLPLLLLGESGTGKELFARAVHEDGAPGGAPFLAVNSGTLSGTLLESELFGYAPGAFTGAAPGGRVGKLAAADGGTLFLDEIGEMSPGVQAMLLRFLEDGSFFPVGGATEQRASVRLITATSRDLPALVREGRFRGDLYFRIRGIVLRLPTLRERGDRRELAEALLKQVAARQKSPKPLGLSPAALAWIERHDWPGNVRELRSALDYALVLAGDAPRVELWHLPVEDEAPAAEADPILKAAERTAVLSALHHSRGNMSAASRHLGVARSTLYRMMERQGLRASGEAR